MDTRCPWRVAAGDCRVSDCLRRLVDTGAGMPIVIHRVLDAQFWLAVRLNHAAGAHILVWNC